MFTFPFTLRLSVGFVLFENNSSALCTLITSRNYQRVDGFQKSVCLHCTNQVVGFVGSSVDLDINLLKQMVIRDCINTRKDLFVEWGTLMTLYRFSHFLSLCSFVPLPYLPLCSGSY